MSIFKVNNWKDALVHVLAIIGIAVLLVFFFFFIYLPVSTNHGETITVPDARGKLISELDDFLGERNLRYEITPDSGFSAEYPPLAVLKQVPMPNTKVKENRKIYLTINAEHSPLVRMPKLIGGSVKNAQLILKSYDLKLGKIKYVSDLALNYVLDQELNGKELPEGTKIPKGSSIDLIVGDGLGEQKLESPDLTNLDLESAQFAIIGSGLKMGNVTHEKEGMAVVEVENEEGEMKQEEVAVPPGTVFKQQPAPGKSMFLGQKVDIWIFSPDSISNKPSILSNP